MLEWYLSSDDTFLFYVHSAGVIVGYCGGLIKRNGKSIGSASGMAQYSFNEAVKAFFRKPWLLMHAEVRKKYSFILKNIKRKVMKMVGAHTETNKSIQAADSFQSYVALVVIGVKSEFQGRGVGSMLLKEFEKKAFILSIPKMLLTVRSDNGKAIRSYERNGWKKSEIKGNSTTMIKFTA